MNTFVLHEILTELMIKYNCLKARDLNKFLAIKNGKLLVSGQPNDFSAAQYITFISKFIYAGLYK